MTEKSDGSKPTPAPIQSKFSQWSEVHDIPRKPSRLAQLALYPGRFMIVGPPELVAQTQLLASQIERDEADEQKFALYQMWSHWYVICSVNKQEILLCDLRYWIGDLIYASPDLIPNPYTPQV